MHVLIVLMQILFIYLYFVMAIFSEEFLYIRTHSRDTISSGGLDVCDRKYVIGSRDYILLPILSWTDNFIFQEISNNTQLFIISINIKAPRHWPLWGGGPVARKLFPSVDDVII